MQRLGQALHDVPGSGDSIGRPWVPCDSKMSVRPRVYSPGRPCEATAGNLFSAAARRQPRLGYYLQALTRSAHMIVCASRRDAPADVGRSGCRSGRARPWRGDRAKGFSRASRRTRPCRPGPPNPVRSSLACPRIPARLFGGLLPRTGLPDRISHALDPTRSAAQRDLPGGRDRGAAANGIVELQALRACFDRSALCRHRRPTNDDPWPIRSPTGYTQ